MEIKDFRDLTGFIYDEYERLTETFGLDKTPKKSIRFAERSIRKYSKLYEKPLFKQEKRKIELETAFDTMPHGFWWKMFHSRLWKKMKFIMENEKDVLPEIKEENEVKPDVFVPAVIVEKDIIEIDAEKKFLTDIED